jgi:hypothetical protein
MNCDPKTAEVRYEFGSISRMALIFIRIAGIRSSNEPNRHWNDEVQLAVLEMEYRSLDDFADASLRRHGHHPRAVRFFGHPGKFARNLSNAILERLAMLDNVRFF